MASAIPPETASINALQAKIDRFESFSKLDPENVDLLLQLGDLYHQAGRFDPALNCYNRALLISPALPAAISRTAAVYLSQHRFADASTLLSNLIAGGERSPALLHNLGLALYYQDRFVEAGEHFAAAEAEGLQQGSNWKYLAHCLHHQGKVADAIDACEKWLATGNSPESRSYLALLEFDNGDRARAGELAREALIAQPENADAKAVIGSLALEDQDIETAGSCFTHILEQRPDYGRAWLGLGLASLHSRKNTEAIDALSKAAEQMPTHAGTLVALGWAKLIALDAAGAEAVFRRALEVDRNFAESHGGLAVALIQLNRIEEAQQTLKVANKLNPANFGSIYANAMLLKLQNQPALAHRLLEKAIEQPAIEGGKPLIEYIRQALTRFAGK